MKILKLNEWVQTSTADINLNNNTINQKPIDLQNELDQIVDIFENGQYKKLGFYVDCSGSMNYDYKTRSLNNNLTNIFNKIYDICDSTNKEVSVFSFTGDVEKLENREIPDAGGPTMSYNDLMKYIMKNGSEEHDFIIIITDSEAEFDKNYTKTQYKAFDNAGIPVYTMSNNVYFCKMLQNIINGTLSNVCYVNF